MIFSKDEFKGNILLAASVFFFGTIISGIPITK
jgi:hypothetical protein